MPQAGVKSSAAVGPRHRFFGGKGGAGKTTCAAAFALGRAEMGRRVLLISTDPAHSLGDALGRKLSSRPGTVPTRRGRLQAVELDTDRALSQWLEEHRPILRTIASRGTYLTEEEIDRFLRLSFPGVDEIMALLEITRLAAGDRFDDVVVDTAPTGHTLRMLEMPETMARIAAVLDGLEEKHRALAQALGGLRREPAEDFIDALREQAGELSRLLREPGSAAFTWVTLPEALAVAETAGALEVLESRGIAVPELIINRLTQPPRGRCDLCEARVAAERSALRALNPCLRGRLVRRLPAFEREPRGPASLRRIASLWNRRPARERPLHPARRLQRGGKPAVGDLGRLLELEDSVELVCFGGKGGVGKTTCAAAFALAAAAGNPRRRVLLLSTDPAHSLGDVLEGKGGPNEWRPRAAPAGLRVREVDAGRMYLEKRESYREAVEELFDSRRTGIGLESAGDRRVAQDLLDLAPPGIDEIFGMLAVLDALPAEPRRGGHGLVVLDTAPTGHALRLLAMPEKAHAWVKELLQILLQYRQVVGLGRLAEDLVELSRGLGLLKKLLTDPARTRFVAVTRAEGLPLAETERLLGSLRKLEISPAAIIVNALTPPGCARCRRRAREESRCLRESKVGGGSAKRAARVMINAPLVAPPPRGASSLLQWVSTWSRA